MKPVVIDAMEIGALDTQAPTPLYYQIYHRFRHRILSGQIAQGSMLPSEAALEASLKVSRITAKRAMDELAKEELVERQRGRGTRVIYNAPPSKMAADFSGLMENLIAIGQSTDVEVLFFEYASAEPSIARALALDAGAIVQRAERRRSRDGLPFSYIVTHIPEQIGRNFGPDDLTQKPILSLIEAHHPEISEAEQSVSAFNASVHIAEVLDVPDNTALLKITRVVRDQNGTPVQHIEVYYRPDVYQLQMRLARVETKDATKIWAAQDTDNLGA